MKKSDTIPKLTKKLDAVFSRFIRKSHEVDGAVCCFTCGHPGTTANMQAGHYLARQYRITRWEEWNVRPQCFACNMYYGGRPQDFRDKLVEEFGEEDVLRKEQQRHEIRKFTREELKDLIELYEKKLESL